MNSTLTKLTADGLATYRRSLGMIFVKVKPEEDCVISNGMSISTTAEQHREELRELAETSINFCYKANYVYLMDL